MMITNEQREILEQILTRGPNSQGNYAEEFCTKIYVKPLNKDV